MSSFPTGDWDDDGKAWDYLAALGFTHKKGVISPPSPDFDFTLYPKAVSAAINYLVLEWDWAYEGH